MERFETFSTAVNLSRTNDSRSPFAIARDVAFIVAIYSYFTGFTYLYFWMTDLGIFGSILDEPPYDIFVYSFQVCSLYWRRIAIYAVLAFVTLIIARQVTSRSGVEWLRRFQSQIRFSVIAIAVILAFKLLYWSASDAAENFVTGIRAGYYDAPNVKVMLKPQDKRYFDAGFLYDNEDFCIAMVGETRSTVYLLDQDVPDSKAVKGGCESVDHPHGSMPEGYVYAVPRDDIISVIVQEPRTEIPGIFETP
jgi:hypothetical protein